MVKSPRGLLGALPDRGGGGMTMGPLPTVPALAGSGRAPDCAWAAPGRGVVAVWASAPAQVVTSKAAANFSNTFFIGFLVSRIFGRPSALRHKKRLEIGVQRR